VVFSHHLHKPLKGMENRGPPYFLTRKERRVLLDLTRILKADQISFIFHLSHELHEKAKKRKQKKTMSPEMVLREISSERRGRLRLEGFVEKVSFESGVEENRCIVTVVMMMMMTNWCKMTSSGMHTAQRK